MNLASDILRHSSALICDILLLYSPDSAIFSDMREICGSFFPVRSLAGGSCEMRESPAECGRVGNYELSDYPPSLVCYKDLHECKDKSTVAKETYERTESYLSEYCPAENEIVSPSEFGVVFDGMAIVGSITKKGNSIRTVNDFGGIHPKVEQRLREEYTIL